MKGAAQMSSLSDQCTILRLVSRLHLIDSKPELKISVDVTEVGYLFTVTGAVGVVGFPGTTRAT